MISLLSRLSRRLRWTFLIAGPLSLSCGGVVQTLPPLGQVLLLMDTDAWIPADPTESPSETDSPYLFDRLRVEVLQDGEEVQGAVSLAERDFAVDAADFADGPVSVGIQPEPGKTDLVVRVRLFRGDRTRDGQPYPTATIETKVRLPAVAEEGITNVFVMLRTDDVGVSRTEEGKVISRGELPTSSQVRTWAPAVRTECRDNPLDGEVCVPGGAYWMGDTRLLRNDDIADSDEERLVVMSPYFIDQKEVTVAQFRAAWEALEAQGLAMPKLWSGTSDGLEVDDYSTYTDGPTEVDPDDEHAALPINAIRWQTAAAYCELQGKQLPSETMYEFVASGRGLELSYVWGNDAPTCDDAVVGRAGYGHYSNFNGDCRPPGEQGGPLPPGSGARDRVELPGGTLLDLGGNMSEWALDWFREQGESQFAEEGPLVDPVGTEPSDGDEKFRAVRGGSWRGELIEVLAATRGGLDPELEYRSVGFRCARRDSP